jgi:dTDP-4-dehydrorhamnose reductase
MSQQSARRRRILLVGPAGQVGSQLLDALAPLGEVVAAGRQLASPGVALDLAREPSIRAAVRAVQPTVIVNAAAYTAVDQAESEPELAFAINARAPGILAEEAARSGAALVHYSTDYVFDGSGTRPWRETDRPAPLNVYGRSKLEGERAIAAAGAAHLILRVSWVYAARGRNFINTMLRLGAQREELTVVADQWGAPTSARAIAEATAQILAQSADTADLLRQHGGVVHTACAGETTWHALAEEVFRLARQQGRVLAVQHVKPILTADYPCAARRPLNSRLDCTLLRQRFGITLPAWPAALAQTLAELFACES